MCEPRYNVLMLLIQVDTQIPRFPATHIERLFWHEGATNHNALSQYTWAISRMYL